MVKVMGAWADTDREATRINKASGLIAPKDVTSILTSGPTTRCFTASLLQTYLLTGTKVQILTREKIMTRESELSSQGCLAHA
jgi:hypothetical protein